MAVHGKDLNFELDDSGGSIVDLSAYVLGSGVDFGRDIEALLTTTAGNDSNTYVPGIKNATFSVEFDFSDTLVDHLDGIYGLAGRSFVYGPSGATGGYNKYSGSCFLTSVPIASPIGLNTVSAEFQVSGDVAVGTY